MRLTFFIAGEQKNVHDYDDIAILKIIVVRRRKMY